MWVKLLPGAMKIQPYLRLFVMAFASAIIASIAAQTMPATTAHADAIDAGYPEQAYLSPSHYINQYFGFIFDLPEDAHLRPLPQPASRDGSIPLLDLAGPSPADPEILIDAIPTAGGGSQDAKVLLREALDQELYRGVEELHGLSKAALSGHQFFYFETRRGIEQHIVFATTMGDYILRAVLAAHDEKVVKRLEASFEHVAFFPPAELRQHLDADAKPYDGPSISSHRLALLESDPPAGHIDSGKMNGDFYENDMLGFSYRVPQGWSLQSQGMVQSAVEQFRAKEDFGRPRMGRVERRLVDACSRTLFSAWAKRPGTDGQISYDDFGEVTVSAMSAACFPTIKFPENATDQGAFRAFISQFALTHPILDDMREAKVFTEDGVTVLFLQGTVAFQIPNDELSRRLSLGIAITQRNGYLVTWFFAAPHDSELRALTNERARFDQQIAVKVAGAQQPGGGTAAEASVPVSTPTGSPTPSSSPGNVPSVTSSPNDGSPSPTANNTPTSSAGSNQSQSAQQSAAPSLLRPGETMDSQQGKGELINKSKTPAQPAE